MLFLLLFLRALPFVLLRLLMTPHIGLILIIFKHFVVLPGLLLQRLIVILDLLLSPVHGANARHGTKRLRAAAVARLLLLQF